MKFLTNTYDPSRNDLKFHLTCLTDESEEEALTNHRAWLADKIIGEPQATSAFTQNELNQMHMVGVYEP